MGPRFIQFLLFKLVLQLYDRLDELEEPTLQSHMSSVRSLALVQFFQYIDFLKLIFIELKAVLYSSAKEHLLCL